MRKSKSKPRRKASGVEEEPVIPAPEIDVDAYLTAPVEEEKPKRKYSKRKSANESSLGVFMRGLGSMAANLTNALVGSNDPLSNEEGEMLQYVGDCVQQFGDTSDFDEQIGSYGKYLIIGAFAMIGVSRVVPALRKRRAQAQIPAATVVQE